MSADTRKLPLMRRDAPSPAAAAAARRPGLLPALKARLLPRGRPKLAPRSPLAQLTLALVLLATTLVVLADLFLGVLPNRWDERQLARQRQAEALAAQVSAVMRQADPEPLRQTLRAIRPHVPQLRSIAVRRADGEVVAAAGDLRPWRAGAGPREAPNQFSIGLSESGRPWGHVEVAYEEDPRAAWRRWLDEPAPRLMLFLMVAGTLAFGLYMRRALQHLDPASVIPDRIQHAFDVMAEGVAVLDGRGRVMMVNRAFRRLHPEAASMRTGQHLSGVPWLAAGLGPVVAEHPWSRAMTAGAAVSGDTLELGKDVGDPRRLVVNCAPITDAGGAVRGCLATFDDVTQLHQANAALQQAMAQATAARDEATAARDEVQRKNLELMRLATRDPLTGCLNRRALYEQLAPLAEQAAREGTPLACVMLDIDHFKSVNDTHGHAVGDRVIQEVAKALLDSARGTDLVCRYGGEEFCVVVPGLQASQLREMAERIRERIERTCGPAVREVPGMKVTVSVGCEPEGAALASVQAMIDHADQALYVAKRAGRNRVAVFDGAAA